MINATTGHGNNDLPFKHLDLINGLVTTTRNILEDGQKLLAHFFVVNTSTKVIRHMSQVQTCESDKEIAAHAVRQIAAMENADFVLMISEAWSLRTDKLAKIDEIYRKYGGIGNSPYKEDVCSFILQTDEGVWAAQPQIKPKGISKKKRTFGEVQFIKADRMDGQFADLLPTKPTCESPTTPG